MEDHVAIDQSQWSLQYMLHVHPLCAFFFILYNMILYIQGTYLHIVKSFEKLMGFFKLYGKRTSGKQI